MFQLAAGVWEMHATLLFVGLVHTGSMACADRNEALLLFLRNRKIA